MKIYVGGSKTGKTTKLIEKIKEYASLNEKMYILVPDQQSNFYELLFAKEFGGSNNKIDIITFSRLPYLIFKNTKYQNIVYLDDEIKRMYLKNIILSNNYEILGKEKNVDEIDQVISRIKEQQIDINNFENIKEQIKNEKKVLSLKLDEIISIYKEYEKLLNGKKDSTQKLEVLKEAISTTKFFENSILFIDGFDMFSKIQYTILESIIGKAKDTFIAITNLDLKSNNEYFEGNNETVANLIKICNKYGNLEYEVLDKIYNQNDELYILNKSLTNLNKEDNYKVDNHNFKNNLNLDEKSEKENILITQFANKSDEITSVAKEVYMLIQNGEKIEDIQLVINDLDSLKTTLIREFERYNIKLNINNKELISKNILIRFLIILINSRNLNLDNMLDFLKLDIVNDELNITNIDIFKLEKYINSWQMDNSKLNYEFSLGKLKDGFGDIKNTKNKYILFLNYFLSNVLLKSLIENLEEISNISNIKNKEQVINELKNLIDEINADYNEVINSKINLSDNILIEENSNEVESNLNSNLNTNLNLSNILDKQIKIYQEIKKYIEKYIEKETINTINNISYKTLTKNFVNFLINNDIYNKVYRKLNNKEEYLKNINNIKVKEKLKESVNNIETFKVVINKLNGIFNKVSELENVSLSEYLKILNNNLNNASIIKINESGFLNCYTLNNFSKNSKITFVLSFEDEVTPKIVTKSGIITNRENVFLKELDFNIYETDEDLENRSKIQIYNLLTSTLDKLYISFSKKNDITNTELKGSSYLLELEDILGKSIQKSENIYYSLEYINLIENTVEIDFENENKYKEEIYLNIINTLPNNSKALKDLTTYLLKGITKNNLLFNILNKEGLITNDVNDEEDENEKYNKDKENINNKNIILDTINRQLILKMIEDKIYINKYFKTKIINLLLMQYIYTNYNSIENIDEFELQIFKNEEKLENGKEILKYIKNNIVFELKTFLNNSKNLDIYNKYLELKEEYIKLLVLKQEIYTKLLTSILKNTNNIQIYNWIKDKNLPSNLSKQLVDEIYKNGINLTVSKLEEYSKFPFRYHLKYVLRINENKKYTLNSMDTGTFIHEVIENVFNEKVEKYFNDIRDVNISVDEILKLEKIHEFNSTNDNDNDNNDYNDNQISIETLENAKVYVENINKKVDTVINDLLKIPKYELFIANTKNKKLTKKMFSDLKKICLEIADTIRLSQYDIYKNEVHIGVPKTILDNNNNEIKEKQDFPQKEMTINNKKVKISGKIDRVDLSSNTNSFRIIDYKSRKIDIDFSKVISGLQIQLVVYGDIISENMNEENSGILYFNTKKSIQKVKGKPNNKTDIKNTEPLLSGIIIGDKTSVLDMDKTLVTGKSKIVPATLKKDGELGKTGSSIISKQDYNKILKITNNEITNLVQKILNGNIEISPYKYQKNSTSEDALKFDEYMSIHKFNPKKNRFRYIKYRTLDDILLTDEENDKNK